MPDQSSPARKTPAEWFAERSHDGQTHAPDCWQWHPGCAYLVGEHATAWRIEAVVKMLLDSGDITPMGQRMIAKVTDE